jgi:UDPglucose--hexose-1-phosphate uridylyltransferase
MSTGTGATDLGGGITRTVRTLADGREIAYYDPEPGHARDSLDRRVLDDAPTNTELRRDPLLDEWVVVAGHRQARTFLPPTSECPLCPTHDDQLTEIPEPDYDVVVFENRFPSLTQHVAQVDPDLADPTTRPGFGRCEVVCFTSDHSSSLAQVTPERLRLVLEAWIDRDRILSAVPGVEYVFVFENRGVEIGVTLSHPHGQIYAYPFVPPRDHQMRAAARAHRERTGRPLYADVIAAEEADGSRIVHDGEHWVAFVPRAARWPYEIQLFTRRPVARLADLNDEERAEFSSMYLRLLRSLDAVLGVQMPYIAAWHQAPVHANDDDSRLFLEVFSLRRAAGKLKYLAGSESAAWVWINDISPEQAAEAIREARDRAGL